MVLIVAAHYIDFGYSHEKVSVRFEKINQSFSIDTLVFDGREVEYIHAGDSELPMFVFVHGSPSNWTSWMSYLANQEILEKYQVLAFNRLGYESNTDRLPEPNLNKQAQVIEVLLDALDYQGKITLVGHSYGGPVIVKYNILYPQRVDKMVLIGASMDPDLEPDKWYFKAIEKKYLRWILPEMFDVSNREILPLRGELEKMQPELKQIQSNILIIHGYKDKLVPFENVDYMHKEFSNAKLKIIGKKNAGHLFVFTKSKETINEILEFCNRKDVNNTD